MPAKRLRGGEGVKYGELLENMLAESRGKITASVLARYRYRLDESDVQFIDDSDECGSMREAGMFEDAWDDVEEWFCNGCEISYGESDIDEKAFESWKKRFTLKVGWYADGTWSHPWCFKHKGKKYNFNWPSLSAEVGVTA